MLHRYDEASNTFIQLGLNACIDEISRAASSGTAVAGSGGPSAPSCLDLYYAREDCVAADVDNAGSN